MRLHEQIEIYTKENKYKNLKIYDFFYKLEEDILEIYLKNLEKSKYWEIEEVFSKIIYNLNESKIINTKEISKNWNKIYNKYLLGENEELTEIVIDLDRYYSNESNLEFISNNFNLFPFLKIIFSKNINKQNILFYELLDFEQIEFNIQKKIIKEKNKEMIIINGEIPSTFDFISLKKKIRNELQISPEKVFDLKIFLRGSFINEEEKNIFGKIEVVLEVNTNIIKNYSIEIIGGNNA